MRKLHGDPALAFFDLVGDGRRSALSSAILGWHAFSLPGTNNRMMTRVFIYKFYDGLASILKIRTKNHS